MKQLLSLFCLAAVLSCPVLGQKNNSTTETPKTKIEAFQAKTGAVIISGFSTVGSLEGLYGGSVKVEAKEFKEASSGKKEYGITVSVKESDRNEHVSYLDYDEIESLLQGLDYIAKIDKKATKLDDFQADYKTKDELEISTYSYGGQTQIAVSTGNIASATVHFEADKLKHIRSLFAEAKNLLNRIK